MSASLAVSFSLIVTLSDLIVEISASLAVICPLITAFSATKELILAVWASSSSISALSAIMVWNSATLSDTCFTESVLADGEEIFPVTTAVWFFTITITRFWSSISVVDVTGVSTSDPSNFTYLISLWTTTVP